MILFKSSNKKTEIFISIWEWCPTWCQSCAKTIKKIKHNSLVDIKEQIDLTNKISDENFSYFLYGTNILENKNITEIKNYLKLINRKYRIQIPIEANINNISQIIDKDIINEFVISKKISSINELKLLINSIKEFYKQNNIIINYDILINKNLILVLEKILKINFNKNNDNTFSKTIWNINLNLRELYNINYKEKKIENLNINSCFVYDSFKIYNNFIEVLDHYEIDKNFDLSFHNPLCFIWNNKITNLKQNNTEIINNFTKYKNHYLEKLNSDFEKNCFKCISTWFDYSKN